jgi:SNF2 family DNA or RNA helicase
MRIKGDEIARKKKYKRDLEMAREEDEPVLFPEAHPPFEEEDGDDSDDSIISLGPMGASRKRRCLEMPRKEPKQMSMQDAELQSMKVALEASEDLPKKKRKALPTHEDSQDTRSSEKGKRSKPKPKSNLKAAKGKAASKTATKGPQKTAKTRREDDHAVKQATSLFNTNIFEQQAREDDPEQPTFRSRRKQDALKELIASVPIEFSKQARSEMSNLNSATKDFNGRGSVKAAGGNWVVRGMTTSLKGYQVLGSAFMRRRENSNEEPRGGLMADQMGLGKTLMMLANIVNGQPKKAVHPRTTLLVASPSLLSQWAQEIDQHTDCGLKVMRYGSGTRIDSNAAFDVLQSHDIILTSYHEVMRSYPKNEPPIECQTAEQKIDWWKTQYETQRGVLHRMMFLRIVLDEAQMIKNHQGRTSIACRALIAQHKWALSGTPIMNNLTELYPYFKFLGVPHTGSFKIFKHNYCDSKSAENTERLLVRLSQFMIRRTHGDKLLNIPILKLPRADQGTFMCDFNPVERCICDIVRERFAKCINMWQHNGELEKSYSNALVMLLRLRQLTAHVLMLQFVMRDLLEVEDIERIKNVVKDTADVNTRQGRTIIAIRKQLELHAIGEKKKAAAREAAKAAGREEEAITDDEEVQEESRVEEESDEGSGLPTGQFGAGRGGSGEAFSKDYNFNPFLASLRKGESWEKAKKKAICSFCGKMPKDPWITSCKHLLCYAPCLENMYLEGAEDDLPYGSCKTCGVTPTSILQVEAQEEDALEGIAQGTRSKSAKKAARQRERRDKDDIPEDWLSLAGTDVLPSAKTLAIKAQILNW